MEYFLSHIWIMVIAAILLALISVGTVMMADINAKNKAKDQASKEDEPKDNVLNCGFGCSGCPSANTCHKPEKE